MANFIPHLEFGPGSELELTFDTPPDGDPQNEVIGNEREQVRSVGGQLFTSEFYDYTNFKLRFILQSNSVATKLKALFKDYGLKGETFNYFPHSDEDTSFPVELADESVQFNRDYPDGQGGFLWSFEFNLVSVSKTAPRIVRAKNPVGPGPRSPQSVLNLAVTSTSTTARLTWDSPLDTGGQKITKFEILTGGSVVATKTYGPLENPASGTHDITGLSPSTNYTYSVVVVNAADQKSLPLEINFTTKAQAIVAPGAVRNLVTNNLTANSVEIDWDAPASSGSSGIAYYQVNVVGQSSIQDTVFRQWRLQGLTASTRYSYRVRAVNVDLSQGPWTTISFTTLAPAARIPTAPNVDSVVLEGSNIAVTFDYPAGHAALANPITSFKIYTSARPQGEFNVRSTVTTKTVQASTFGTARANLKANANFTVNAIRNKVTAITTWVTAINSIGESLRSNLVTYNLPRAYGRDIHSNFVDGNGDYVYTPQFGSVAGGSRTHINLSNGAEWSRSTAFVGYRWSNQKRKIISIQPSLTSINEMAIIASVYVGQTSTTIRKRILLLKWNTAANAWLVKDFVPSSAIPNGLTAFVQLFNGVRTTRYCYAKFGDRNIRITADTFSAVDTSWRLTHEPSLTVRNCALCVNGGILYVSDYNLGKVYAYDINTGARRPNLDITTLSNIYPTAMWTNGIYLWIVGCSQRTRFQYETNKVYCYNLSTKARVPSREFNLDANSRAQRVLDGVDYTGLMATHNEFKTVDAATAGTSTVRAMSAFNL